MTIARTHLICIEQTPYYHCTVRCVRRAFLCGRDRFTGNNFDHRKQWLENRMRYLSAVFAVDLLAYAIMSNHYHAVVHINPIAAKTWSDDQVIERWQKIFSLPDIVTSEHVDRWRQRLCNLSWYMRCLNEPLARWANREDECKGRFWEGRFHSQALLDEAAVLKCMTYVDLNPIRAGVARSPETSPHTSVKARIERRDKHLMPMRGTAGTSLCVPMRRRDYLQLVDWTGRCVRPDRRGRIPGDTPPILDRLRFDGSEWAREIASYGRWYCRAVGSMINMDRYCQYLGQQWLIGVRRQRLVSRESGAFG